MNEERINQLKEIENKAQTLFDTANREAQCLPQQAEKEARELLDKTRSDAQHEAKHLIAEAEQSPEPEQIIQKARDEADKKENLAMNNMDRAVKYVLNRIAGRE